jgi:hypothetical protein
MLMLLEVVVGEERGGTRPHQAAGHWRLAGQIFRKGEEPHERSALVRDLVSVMPLSKHANVRCRKLVLEIALC